MKETNRFVSYPLNQLNKAAGGNLAALSHFGKDEVQVLLAQTLLCANVHEDTFQTVDAYKVVVHNGSFGNVFLEAGWEFLCVTAIIVQRS